MNEEMKNNLIATLRQLNHSLQITNDEIFATALRLLQEDLRNHQLSGLIAAPDDYATRANNIAFLFIKNHLASAAEILYQLLIDETIKHTGETNTQRHMGAFYANKGVACALQGNLDQAVVEFLRASEEDKLAYGSAKERSFALVTLLPEYFVSPLQKEILVLAQHINPNLTVADIERLIRFLGSRSYAFIAYIKTYHTHHEALQVSDNLFSKLQILSSFRNLCALLEIELKIKASTTEGELLAIITQLYKNETWWKAFIHAKDLIKGTRKVPRSVNDELRDSFSVLAPDEDTMFWKSLLIGYITRNHTIHQMDTTTHLVTHYSQQIMAHLMYAMIKVAL